MTNPALFTQEKRPKDLQGFAIATSVFLPEKVESWPLLLFRKPLILELLNLSVSPEKFDWARWLVLGPSDISPSYSKNELHDLIPT